MELPLEIYEQIFSWQSIKDVLNNRQVCQEFNHLIKQTLFNQLIHVCLIFDSNEDRYVFIDLTYESLLYYSTERIFHEFWNIHNSFLTNIKFYFKRRKNEIIQIDELHQFQKMFDNFTNISKALSILNQHTKDFKKSLWCMLFMF